MARFTPLKRDILDSLADEFLHHYSKGRTFLAVDGIDGAGKTWFADALAVRLGRGGHSVIRASIDGFHRPRALRYARGAESPEGFYEDSYDYDLFRRVLVDPFRLGGSAGVVTAAWDVARDTPVELAWQTAPQDATLLVDGIFLLRPELRGLWNYSIWLDVAQEVADARLLERDGAPPKLRYLDGQKLYIAEADPRARASAIVDNSDYDHPRRVFADSC
jgi:uridine kinase